MHLCPRSQHCGGLVSIRLADLDTAILSHSSLQNLSSSFRLHGDQMSAIFKSNKKFSLDWLQNMHLVVFKLFLCSFACMCQVMSCWKINLLPTHDCLALWIRLSSRICKYFAAFNFPSTFRSLLGPAVQMHIHNMMSLPPYFTVGIVWCAVFGVCQT